MPIGKLLAKAATKANKNAGGIAAAGAVAGVGGAGIASKKKESEKPKKTPQRPPASTMYNKGGSVCKTKKYNTGGDVKTGLEKGIRSATILSRAHERRMEENDLAEPYLTKRTSAKDEQTSQYAGKKFQMSAERKAKQDAENRKKLKEHFEK